MKAQSNFESRYDAIVVGARVAGAATAMLLARAGLSVLAVDKSAYGSDTTSTHALMRAGVMQLLRWGLLDRLDGAGTPAIRKTTFHYADEAIAIAIPEKHGVDALYAPRRTVLDSLLVDAAREAGVQVEHGVRVDELLRNASGRVIGVNLIDGAGISRRVEAGIVIGADGVRSRVAAAVGAEVLHDAPNPSACIYGYWRGLDLDGTHWYYDRGVAAGAIPTNDGLACVFVSMPPERYEAHRAGGIEQLFMDVAKENDPQFARDIARAERVGKLHPFAGRPGFIRESWGPGWALVGDAGYFKDPLTAHGMTDALRDAELLAKAIVSGTDDALAEYQSARDAMAVEFLDLTDRIASFDWSLDEAKAMHHRLSKLMNHECDVVAALDAAPAVA